MLVTLHGQVLNVREVGSGDRRFYVIRVYDGERSVGEVLSRTDGLMPGDRYVGRVFVEVGKYGLRFREVERLES